MEIKSYYCDFCDRRVATGDKITERVIDDKIYDACSECQQTIEQQLANKGRAKPAIVRDSPGTLYNGVIGTLPGVYGTSIPYPTITTVSGVPPLNSGSYVAGNVYSSTGATTTIPQTGLLTQTEAVEQVSSIHPVTWYVGSTGPSG